MSGRWCLRRGWIDPGQACRGRSLRGCIAIRRSWWSSTGLVGLREGKGRRRKYWVYDADHAVADAGVYGGTVEECGLVVVSDAWDGLGWVDG